MGPVCEVNRPLARVLYAYIAIYFIANEASVGSGGKVTRMPQTHAILVSVRLNFRIRRRCTHENTY